VIPPETRLEQKTNHSLRSLAGADALMREAHLLSIYSEFTPVLYGYKISIIGQFKCTR